MAGFRTHQVLLAGAAIGALATPSWAQVTSPAVSSDDPAPDATPSDNSPQAATPTGTVDANGQPRTNDDIVVTAQRRDESLSRTPVSVAVISADTLAKAQVVSENDLRLAAPGLQVRSGGNSNQLNFAIRGESQDPFSNVRPGVLPYVNDVQIGGAGGASAFYDLQSVQVLKGPQGTLFGRSATGGAILFTTAKPTDQFGGYISGLYGNYDAKKIEGALNVPLIGDRLMARVAGFYRDRNGYQRNLYDGSRVGDQKQYGGRGSLTAKLGVSFQNELVVDYFHSDSENTTAVLSGLVPFTGSGAPFIPVQLLYSGTATPAATITGECTLQGFAGLGACPPVLPPVAGFYTSYFSDPRHPASGLSAQLAAQQARGPYVVNTDAANVFRANNTILTNTSTLDVGPDTQIKNIFGYTRIRSFTAQESDGTPYDIASGTGLTSHTTQLSEELQLLGKLFGDRLDYVVGGYFSSERSRTTQNSSFFDLVFGGFSQTNDFRITNRTLAAYGQATYRLNDSGLAATIGARYTSERVGIHVLPGDTIRQALGPTPPPGYDYDQDTTYNRLSWTLGLQDQISPAVLIYATNRRAYKSGGYNGIVQPKVGFADVSGNAYRAQRVTDAEVGTKLNGRLGDVPTRLNVALFYSWIRDSQRAAFSLVNGGPAGLTVNVPDGKTYGAEVDGQIRQASCLAEGATCNYTKASFVSTPVAVNGSLQVFDQVPDTPKFTGSVFADITVPVSSDIAAIAHGDVYRQSQSFTAPRSIDSVGARLAPYTLVNFRLGVEDARSGWSLTANLKNAFKKTYYVGGVATGEIYQINLLLPGEPRTFMVEARFKF